LTSAESFEKLEENDENELDDEDKRMLELSEDALEPKRPVDLLVGVVVVVVVCEWLWQELDVNEEERKEGIDCGC